MKLLSKISLVRYSDGTNKTKIIEAQVHSRIKLMLTRCRCREPSRQNIQQIMCCLRFHFTSILQRDVVDCSWIVEMWWCWRDTKIAIDIVSRWVMQKRWLLKFETAFKWIGETQNRNQICWYFSYGNLTLKQWNYESKSKNYRATTKYDKISQIVDCSEANLRVESKPKPYEWTINLKKYTNLGNKFPIDTKNQCHQGIRHHFNWTNCFLKVNMLTAVFITLLPNA